MKFEINQNLTKNKIRTLKNFKTQMFKSLSIMSFEEITVEELCKTAEYPRATFYNYFSDKYDLLDYCFESISSDIGIEFKHKGLENELLFETFDKIYDFSKENINIIKSIMIHNPENSYMFLSALQFLSNKMKLIFKDCDYANNKLIPKDLLSEHYANTLFLVWKWSIISNDDCTKIEAKSYLENLVSNIK